MIPRIERHRCGVHAFGGRPRGGRLARGLALAYAQVQPRAFQQLALVWITLLDGAKEIGSPGEIVTLQILSQDPSSSTGWTGRVVRLRAR